MPNVPESLLVHVRQLRQQHTDAEKLLWHLLRNRQLAGFKFRRQFAIPPYIVDFYCHEAKLVIEADGGQHTINIIADQQRTAFLESKKLTVLRFWNHDIFQETEAVLETIAKALPEY